MSLFSFAEVFHGCKQSADFFIRYLRKQNDSIIYVVLENLSPLDATIIQKLREEGQFDIQTYRKYLVDKRGLMMTYILKKIHKLKNIIILGIDDSDEDPTKRFNKMYDSLIDHLKNGKNIYYYGFHLGYDGEGPQKNILDRELKQQFDIKTFGMFSPRIKSILLLIDQNIPNSIEKRFKLENETFSEYPETYFVSDISDHIPCSFLEQKCKPIKGSFIFQSPKHAFFRQAGIWFAVYLQDKSDSIMDYYCSSEIYDYLVYLPKAEYLN
jgi:hypothetical protein